MWLTMWLMIFGFIYFSFFISKRENKRSKDVAINPLTETKEETLTIEIVLRAKEKTFLYRFDNYSCYKKRKTGICSLMGIPPINILEEKKIEDYHRSYYYCKNLSEHILTHGMPYDIFIEEVEEGIYFINDGQHRLCIAQYFDLEVKVFLTLPKKWLVNYSDYKICDF